jgi:predicted phosphodiesterase
MVLYALGDLHVGHPENRAALAELRDHPTDWLVVVGDVGETPEHLKTVLEATVPRFAQVAWVPGNHELYVTPNDPCQLRGEARYLHLCEIARNYGVLTPEDPWALLPLDGPPRRLILLFLGFDYTWGPPGTSPEQVVAWAREEGLVVSDERYLHPDPFADRAAWCSARVAAAEARLAELPPGERWVVVNHWPLRRDLVRLFRLPRFVPWCGTDKTESWHERYPIEVAIHGHLHMRATDWRAGVRFEEVAIGYPRHWDRNRGLEGYLRPILPGPPVPLDGWAGPIWHR